ncbi:MAG TPA: hypothetical protein VF032_12435 [Thermoleophilaceae bacterium]
MRPRIDIARARRALPAAVAAACLIAAPAASAHQHRLKLRPLKSMAAAAESVRLFHPQAPDRVRPSVLNARAARRITAHASTTSFRTADGVSIPVAVSSAYTPDPTVEQGYVNLLGGLVHGSELGKISVYIATPGQIENSFCGQGALACYVGDEERMYVPGVGEKSDPPVQFLIAHEYGHHIELNRSNAPWSAYDKGVKQWASYENVCALERRGRIGTNYYNDPSEAFAESYADMQFPGVDFIYTDVLAPDRSAFRAIRADVLNPWTGSRSVTLHGSFADRGHPTRTFRLHTPLDGTAGFELTVPEGASYRLRLLGASHTSRRHMLHAASNGSYTVCGARTLSVQVTRVVGSGPFSIAASLP